MPAVQFNFAWLHAALEEKLSAACTAVNAGVAYIAPHRPATKSEQGVAMGISLAHQEQPRVSSSDVHSIDWTYEIGLRFNALSGGVSLPVGRVYSVAGALSAQFRNWVKVDAPTTHELHAKAVTIECSLRGAGEGAEEVQQAVITVTGHAVRQSGSTQATF